MRDVAYLERGQTLPLAATLISKPFNFRCIVCDSIDANIAAKIVLGLDLKLHQLCQRHITCATCL